MMTRNIQHPTTRIFPLLGPAFVAAIAYVDPGNVASNITGGARYGYLLVWVILAANLMAMVVQYQSAKLGLVTGRTLPELLGQHLKPWTRRGFWLQAEGVAIATDLAEVLGGAIALHLLFGLPLLLGGIVIGLASMALLQVQTRHGQKRFEMFIAVLLGVISIGFLTGLIVAPPSLDGFASGLAPRFDGNESVLLAASILGATIMPHAIYLHSALSRDRHLLRPSSFSLHRLLKATRVDVIVALLLAGAVNLGMLLLAASTLHGTTDTDTIEGAHAAIASALGPIVGTLFAVGLLASGLASTSVGSYAGATIMEGLLAKRIPLLLRRVITLIPALVLLALGADPTWTLVWSQVILSFGIPFALTPLFLLVSSAKIMGPYRSSFPIRLLMLLITTLVAVLNVVLIVLTLTGN